MRKLVAALTAAGVMAGVGVMTTTSAEAHWRHRGCCTYTKQVRYYRPVTKLVKRVRYVRVRSYRTVYAKRAYRSWCGCRRHYRTVRYYRPVTRVVPRVTYVRVRSYRPYVVTRRFRRHCCR